MLERKLKILETPYHKLSASPIKLKIKESPQKQAEQKQCYLSDVKALKEKYNHLLDVDRETLAKIPDAYFIDPCDPKSRYQYKDKLMKMKQDVANSLVKMEIGGLKKKYNIK